MSSSNDCHDLYFFGEDLNPRHVSIMGYEGDRPIFIQFVTTTAAQTATQSRVYRDQSEAAVFHWTTGTHLGLLTIGDRHLHMGQLIRPKSQTARRFLSPVDGLPFEWRRTQSQDYELFSPGDRRIATYSRISYQTNWGVCHGVFRYTFKNQDVLLLEALLALALNRWVDMNGTM